MTWVGISRAARVLDVSPNAVFRMAKDGKLETQGKGRGVRVRLEKEIRPTRVRRPSIGTR
ncbi:MAG: hypothetical protein Phyf2KO_00620 [Phycisphaerales bacterium]